MKTTCRLSYILLIGGLNSLSACTNHAAPTPSVEGNWALISTQNGENTLSVSASKSSDQFTLNLLADGTGSGKTGCNQWRGTHQLESGKLKLSSTGQTKKRCHFKNPDHAALAQSFPVALSKGATPTVTGTRLTLTLPSGDIWVFSKRP